MLHPMFAHILPDVFIVACNVHYICFTASVIA